MSHPYVTFCAVPSMPSWVSLPIDFAKLDQALRETLKKVSARNKALIPAALYERAKP